MMNAYLADTLPTSDRIQDALYGFTRSQMLFTALDLDIFSHMTRGDNTVEKLTAAIGADKRGLRIFLDGLVGIGFLEKNSNQVYTLPADVATYLDKASPQFMGGMVKHCKRLYDNWSGLRDAVMLGMPSGGAQGLAQLETYFSELVKGLYVSNYPTAKNLAIALGMGSGLNRQHILDVAGGSGVWSIALLEQDLTSKATLLDLPTVISVAKECVALHHLENRFEYWPADMDMVSYPNTTYDMAILGNICHAIGPDETQRLIAKLSETLKPGGRLVIIDFVPDDARSQAGWPLMFGVNMLVSTPDGNVFTLAEYTAWLKAVGFISVERLDLDSEVTAVVGIKSA